MGLGEDLLELFIELEEAKGAVYKKGLLKSFTEKSEEHDYLLKMVLRYTLDPYKVYRISADIPVDDVRITEFSFEAKFDEFLDLLDLTMTKQLVGNGFKEELRVFFNSLPPDYTELFKRILYKDLKVGVQAATVNTVFPDLIPGFKCALAKGFDEKQLKFPVYADVKYDGKRTICLVENSVVRLYSRNGIEIEGYQVIKDHMIAFCKTNQIENIMFDGELMFGMFGDRKAIENECDYIIFDTLPIEEFKHSISTQIFATRLERLKKLAEACDDSAKIVFSYSIGGEIINNLDELADIYADVIDSGFEGLVIKSLKSVYNYSRNYAWMKMKSEEGPLPDLSYGKIVGFQEGKGKRLGKLGAFIVNIDGIETGVGSGFNNEQIVEYYDEKYLDKEIEIKHQGKTPRGKLRFPVFNGFTEESR
jgi:ATP-dependent DNA ligase